MLKDELEKILAGSDLTADEMGGALDKIASGKVSAVQIGAFLGALFIPTWRELLARHVPCPPEIRVSALAERADVTGAVAAAIRSANDGVVLSRGEAD